MDFTGLVLGFCSAALSYMGSDESETDNVNLPLAKQNIDILLMLEEKTKGNLTQQEEELLAQAVLDLKGRYSKAKNES